MRAFYMPSFVQSDLFPVFFFFIISQKNGCKKLIPALKIIGSWGRVK